MSQTLLDATWRLETMIGRREELDRIREAIYGNPRDKSCRVVLITGPGGIGKSRLLEEIQWRAGHPDVRKETHNHAAPSLANHEDWTGLGDVTISDTIDLLDIHLTARNQMVQSMRRALARVGGVDFENYEAAERAYLDKLRASASFDQISQHAKAAETAFWEDFKTHAQERRIVLIFDTAERLVLQSSKWLIKHGLLHSDEMSLSSQQWITDQILHGRLVNTTLIFAGRAEEGRPFFQEVHELLSQAGIALEEIELRSLNEGETAQYFRRLAEEWQSRVHSANGSRGNGDYDRIRRFMEALAEDQEQLSVLHLITSGLPVLLSLYGDLIHETEAIPDLLRQSREDIIHALQQQGESALQSKIERSFVDILFQRPGLRSNIMQALARCPAGLSAEQLHFLLDSPENSDVSTWRPSPSRVAEIQEHLDQIRRLSIARPRPDGRLGLQDEIYRIYAQCMGNSEALRSYEAQQRQIQYAKLSSWSAHRLNEAQAQLRAYLDEDERRIAAAIRLPTQALRPYIPPPTSAEQEERAKAQQQIWDWEAEKLHYELLRDPAAGLNEDYTDLTEKRWLASNEEADFIAQQELWRVLHEKHALHLQFTGYTADQINRFQVAALEEDPTRWIKRFVLQRRYDRAVKFCDAVEQQIRLEAPDQRRSWERPINAAERSIWRGYAKIMQGINVQETIQEIERAIQLLNTSDDSFGEKANIRRLRVIGAGYNFAGYGYAAPLGQFRQAVETYGRALWFTRQTRSAAQQAGIRNNLARALASLGREERGHRVCADALELRRLIGAEIPVAYSLNTLALIDNAMQRIPTAWRQAAQAAAIFRRAGDTRGLGLALIQLGIGLRRLANSRETISIMEAAPAELYDTAQFALGEAIEIFKKTPEVLRTIEATLELGCVLRDQMRLIDLKVATPQEERRLKRFYRDAAIELDRAITAADRHEFAYLALQAEVDLAWTHYYANEFDEVEPAINRAEKRIPEGYFITPESGPSAEATETQYFYQLAKLQGLLGAVNMNRFKARLDELRLKHTDKKSLYQELSADPQAKQHMEKAADGYVLSLHYGQLFSPRSRSLAITYDQIYERIKGFNPDEYRMFYEAQRQATAKYFAAKGETGTAPVGHPSFDFSNLKNWLNDCFGLPLEMTNEQAEHDE